MLTVLAWSLDFYSDLNAANNYKGKASMRKIEKLTHKDDKQLEVIEETNKEELPKHNKNDSENGIIANIKSFIKNHKVASIIVLFVVLFTIIFNINNAGKNVVLEEYDIKGLTVKEACEKVRGAGWTVDGVRHIEDYSNKTDCYNESIMVTDYYYWDYDNSVTIYFGEKKTEEEKKNECEAKGYWYRDSQCKSQEEWENDYKWKDAHSACKKYGANAYAKTLTDCYVGSDYMGTVDGQPANDDVSGNETQSPAEVQSEAVQNTQPVNNDNPDQIPEDEVSTGIAACRRVAKDNYGLKIKVTDFANGYVGNEDYAWMFVFKGSSYSMVTCQYHWKTGYAEIMYINI